MDDLIIIGKHYYCPYCGQEISKDENGQYVCHCEDATKARQIEREAMQLEWSARSLRNSKPKPRFCERIVCAPIPDNPTHTEDEPNPSF
ncbi:MAG: hypothetical protein J6X18_02680 [Bacteroidales bacterium]|nr:hypothetical protein [Bacteroidales bacterium]